MPDRRMSNLDPFRDSETSYASDAIARHADEYGDQAAAHVRSQQKLGMTDVEYGRFAAGELARAMSDEQAARYAQDLKAGR